MLEYITCNLCGADDYRILYKSSKEIDPKNKFSTTGGIMGTDQIVKCNKCGLIYVNPRHSVDEIVGAYSEAEEKGYVSQTEERRLTFERCLNLVEKYSKPGRILDIGCASGIFLDVAKKGGWEVFGVEPCKWLVNYGNKNFGLNIIQGTLKEANFPSNYFDAITMWDVLEHTPDPAGELKEASRLLKNGGLLIVNFPDIGDILARIAGRKWWFLLSVHLYYFTPKTLREMLKKTGFEPFKKRLHFQILTLGYLSDMLRLYSKPISCMMSFFTKALRIENLKITYYASQVNIISKKI
ncbi:TPA: hypothetical protein DCX16_01110 [bacterium]|nr:hypothetical protein [bacterium]